MRVALLQVASPLDEPADDRILRVGEVVERAAADGAELIVLPELWATGYFDFARYRHDAQPIGTHSVVTTMRDWARSLRVDLFGGSVLELGDADAVHNTAVLIARDGRVVHTYRKIHVFGHQSRESDLLTAGSTLASAPTPFGTVGVATCYDVRFPEVFRALVNDGAQIALVPAAWPITRIRHWQLLTSARAVENQMYVVACNSAGRQGDVQLGGRSRIVDPWGNLVVEAANTDEQILMADIDRDVVIRARHDFPVLDDRILELTHCRDDRPHRREPVLPP